MDASAQEGRFAGGTFHPGVEGGRARGIIELGPQRLVFTVTSPAATTTRFEFPLDGLEISRGGAGKRLFFFTHPGQPEVTVYTDDRRILRAPELDDLPDLAAQIARLRARARRGRVVALVVLFAIAAVPVGLYLARDALATAVVRQVPVAWEERLGDAAFDQLGAGRRFLDDAAAARALERLVRPLLAAIDVDEGGRKYTFRFHILEDTARNAFALPGGHVTLHTGLIVAAGSPEEVLGVLAHEIAHVTRQHGLRQLVSSAGLFLILRAVVGDAGGILAAMAENSGLLLTRKFSRDAEREADDTGWRYLVDAGIDPRGMVRFFEKIAENEQRLNDGPAGAVLSVLGTHPATAERIESLRARHVDLQPGATPPQIDEAFETLRARVRELAAGG